ncbi:unnamed protein product, partial [Effrenium voratum]
WRTSTSKSAQSSLCPCRTRCPGPCGSWWPPWAPCCSTLSRGRGVPRRNPRSR